MTTFPCAFCGTDEAPTMDHVPPKCLFTVIDDLKMVTAPACSKCHGKSQKDDPTLRNVFSSIRDTETHPVAKVLAAKRDRSLSREKCGEAEMWRLLQCMKKADLTTPAGIYLGKTWAFDFKQPIFQRFAERLSRALLWHEFRVDYFQGIFDFQLNPDLPSLVYEGMMHFGEIRKVGDVFVYGVVGFRETDTAWVAANFFGNFEFFVQIKKI